MTRGLYTLTDLTTPKEPPSVVSEQLKDFSVMKVKLLVMNQLKEAFWDESPAAAAALHLLCEDLV